MARSRGQSKKTGNRKPRHEDDEGSDQEKITSTSTVERSKKDSGPEEPKKAKTSSDTMKRTHDFPPVDFRLSIQSFPTWA